jgi:hypothetical protein
MEWRSGFATALDDFMAQNGLAPSRSSPGEVDLPSFTGSAPAALRSTAGGRTVPPRVEQALAILLESYHYAHDIGCPVWEFAVEIDAFKDLGLTSSDWRWLCYKGLVSHARERTLADETERNFRHGGVLRLTRRTCFVLTDDGEQFARRLLAEGATRRAPVPNHTDAPSTERPAPALLDACQISPTWDRDRQQLRVGAAIVKEFKLPAPNQETILAAFQEENWPPRIDDPLSPQGEVDPKRRLHDTITSLNRNQKEPLIRFLGDGSGQGVRWEFFLRSRGNGKR